MQSLLFVTTELPYPSHSGGKLKSLKLLSELCSQYRVDVACPLKLDDPQYVDEFLDLLPDTTEFMSDAVSRPRNLINLLRSYGAGIPLNVYRTESKSLREKVESTAECYDAIFVDHYEAFQYVPEKFQGKIIYHAHNAYYAFWKRYSQVGNGFFHRVVANFEAKRVAHEERRICESSDLVFAAPNDIKKLESLGIDSRKFTYTYHLGDDTQLAQPSLDYKLTDKKLVYVGHLGWEPNVHGLMWFIGNVWPELINKEPELHLRIIGKSPDPRLIDATRDERGITLTGFVEDLETEFNDSRVCIAPLLFGSGMKVKVLNALARGIPTVTTTVGAEGIDAINDQHLVCTDDPASMAKAILKLMRDEVAWQLLSTESRKLIQDKYTWRALFDHMLEQMNLKLNETGPTTSLEDTRSVAA